VLQWSLGDITEESRCRLMHARRSIGCWSGFNGASVTSPRKAAGREMENTGRPPIALQWSLGDITEESAAIFAGGGAASMLQWSLGDITEESAGRRWTWATSSSSFNGASVTSPRKAPDP